MHSISIKNIILLNVIGKSRSKNPDSTDQREETNVSFEIEYQ
jgi:hypothetical protein